MLKRLVDIVGAFLGLLILLPLFVIVSLGIILGSKGPALFVQSRVGKGNRDFKLYKFRTMFLESDKKGLLTVGGRDPRITPLGFYLRKYKIDELPQLLNVFIGNMSLVGPRPEVRKYVDLYTDAQKEVLSLKPGITDYASLEYFHENDLLAKSEDPEKTYIHEIMPAKLALNQQYIKEAGLITDMKIIGKTLGRILGT